MVSSIPSLEFSKSHSKSHQMIYFSKPSFYFVFIELYHNLSSPVNMRRGSLKLLLSHLHSTYSNILLFVFISPLQYFLEIITNNNHFHFSHLHCSHFCLSYYWFTWFLVVVCWSLSTWHHIDHSLKLYFYHLKIYF